ncbi:MAG: PAS domain-containing protein, partial [Syntrophobacteraceae bacterium]|nr:PAS domain-containing protein [Syntrophobacteraceae bacterium]
MNQHEDELKAFQGFLENIHRLAQHADGWYMLLDREGRVQYLNEYAAACLAICPRDFIGKDIADVLPAHSDELARYFEKIILASESLSFEYEFPCSGIFICFLFNFCPLKQSNGKVIAHLCTAHDITKRREREELILRSKQEWLRILDSIPYLLAVVDNNYHIERINAAMASRLKVTVRRAVGMTCYKLLHGLSKPPAFCPVYQARKPNVQAAIHKGSLIEITDDHLGCESIRVIPLREGQGIVKGCIYVGNPSGDIPVELQARQCIRSLIRRVDHLVRIQDPTGKYMFFRAIESGNLIDVEVHGKTPFDFFEPNVACKMVEHVERVRVSGRDLTETSEVGWKGEIFHFLDRIFPLRDIAGKLIGVVTISKKISGSKRAGVPPRLLKADAGSLS